MCISIEIKIRHKLIEIEDRVSDRFVIHVTNHRWLRILEVIRYRRRNRHILKNTWQIYKIHSFINERDFDNMSLVINFSIDKWRITSIQKCSFIHLVIPIINNNKTFRSFNSKENIHKKEVGPYRGFGYKSLIGDLLASISKMRKTGMGRELTKESIACRPCSLNFEDKLVS